MPATGNAGTVAGSVLGTVVGEGADVSDGDVVFVAKAAAPAHKPVAQTAARKDADRRMWGREAVG